jgi:hypothetical protein
MKPSIELDLNVAVVGDGQEVWRAQVEVYLPNPIDWDKVQEDAFAIFFNGNEEGLA